MRRIHRLDGFVVDAEPMLHLGLEILGHHIGVPRQPHKQRVAAWILKVQRQAALVAMQVLLVGTAPVTADAPRVAPTHRRFDLQHVRTPVGK